MVAPPLQGPLKSTPLHSLRDVLAYNVRAYRVQRGLSQEKLGFAAELDRTFISQVERARVNVSVDNIEKLARSLEVDPSSLLARPEKAKKRKSATEGKIAK
ncbi:helix-turn-helix domain-containing protein [Variovorax sp. PAMC 28711]|uniref:helix-turn-helix domain-containing protein n=1 Tax=Variovorax sp. PAMC 28711 TaxID=1795631 RepID=UPI00143C4153|nr:helix-turn-helix transcriptional regulator [Variovorax sp. PAMC 28711]